MGLPLTGGQHDVESATPVYDLSRETLDATPLAPGSLR